MTCGSIDEVWVMPERPYDPPADQGGTRVPRPVATRSARTLFGSEGRSSSSLLVHQSNVPSTSRSAFHHLFGAAEDRACYSCSMTASGSLRQATPANLPYVNNDSPPHHVKPHVTLVSLMLELPLQGRRAVWWEGSVPARASKDTPGCSRCLRRK